MVKNLFCICHHTGDRCRVARMNRHIPKNKNELDFAHALRSLDPLRGDSSGRTAGATARPTTGIRPPLRESSGGAYPSSRGSARLERGRARTSATTTSTSAPNLLKFCQGLSSFTFFLILLLTTERPRARVDAVLPSWMEKA